MRHKIAIIIPYFGKLPGYFPYFIQSIHGQPFDVFFFSDIEQPKQLPSNAHWHKMGLEEVKQLMDSKLGIKTNFSNAYKICDFKPALGLVFSDYIFSYHFWGSLDLDTVMGNFGHFITDELLNGIDFYSGVKEYVSGSFFLVRNNPFCNVLFKKSKDWLTVLQQPTYSGFDECGGHFFAQLKQGKTIFELKTPIQSFTEVVFLEMNIGLRTRFTACILEPKGFLPVRIQQDALLYKEEEYLLLHFIYLKTRYYFFAVQPALKPVYFINSLGSFTKRPNYFNCLFSKNFRMAIQKKIHINLNKLKP